MKVIDTVKRFDSLIPLNWCNLVTDFIDSRNIKNLSTVAGEKKEIRNVKGLSFVPENYSLRNCSKRDLIKKIPVCMFSLQIRKLLEVPLLNYSVMFPEFDVSKILQIDFLKYQEGGKYEKHSDRGSESSTSRNRYISVIINLNSNYEGGEFIFFNPTTRNDEIVREEKLTNGSVLMFPSNFLFPHSVKPITRGTRYSLVCWLA
jgi:Rps23 Pro-64 3,4-dihydroxylase Tpa1-like proline 4-hydroxylase